ncbi:flagellar biosynthetic protein FliO [Virgibacillus byunsanensis]|uniref:Flagellar biosynthetic protein FliO n=1 Tax=Virgibacillus byunsanensis TaxID=570945 RepID=A0ABW3LM25_9BACI
MVIKKSLTRVSILVLLITMGLNVNFQVEAAKVPECMEIECNDEGEPIADETKVTTDDSAESESVGVSTGSLIFNLIKLVLALLLVLGLIYGLLKFLNKRNKLFSKVKALENLGGISVGPSKSVQIIRIGSSYYVIGVGDNIEMLQEITDEEMIKDLNDDEEPTKFDPNRLITSLFPKKENTDEESSKDHFKNLFTTELDKLKKNRTKIINRHKEDKNE